MKSLTALLESKGIKVGATIATYYGNGSFIADIVIDRMSEYFVFSGERRESHNSVLTYLKKGLWRVK